MKLQTFCESGFEFKVGADVCAVGHYVPLPETPAIAIVPGPPAVWRAVLPSLRRPGEAFHFGLKRSEEHTSELQSLMRISYAVFCLQKKHHSNINRPTLARHHTLLDT